MTEIWALDSALFYFIRSNSKGGLKMKRPSEISSKFKKADVELRNYILELEKENARLQKKNIKMEMQDISNQKKIKILEKLASEEKIIIKTNCEM
jgi:hypothetical protein